MARVKIKSIQKISRKMPVYDIVGVPKNHNFVANDMVVHNCDEAVRFAAAADWNLRESKELRKKLAQVRTKHLFFILCFPLKVNRIESNFLHSFVNFWIDNYARGMGAIYVKDKNPSKDPWRIKAFDKLGSFTEFTPRHRVEEILQSHPNFWQLIKFPKPPRWLYDRYLKVREENVYNEDSVFSMVTKNDIITALLHLALRDIMEHDANLNVNRVIMHVKQQYDFNLTKPQLKAAIDDAIQLVKKVQSESYDLVKAT